MIRGLAILLLLLAGCVGEPTATPVRRALRIVSLDYCADQYLLKLVDRRRIAAVSPDASAEFSYMRAAAVGMRSVRPTAEDVLLLRPDLVVRSYGGGAGAAAMFERAGVPVLQIGFAEDLDSVRRVLGEVAEGLGVPDRGAAMQRDFDGRLARLGSVSGSRAALYLTPGGVTTGSGSLVDAVMRAGGLRNFVETPGWGPLPLERMAYERPDVVVGSFFDTRWNRPDPWSAAGHPVVARAIAGRPQVSLPGAWTACGGWFVLDAAERLARVAR